MVEVDPTRYIPSSDKPATSIERPGNATEWSHCYATLQEPFGIRPVGEGSVPSRGVADRLGLQSTSTGIYPDPVTPRGRPQVAPLLTNGGGGQRRAQMAICPCSDTPSRGSRRSWGSACGQNQPLRLKTAPRERPIAAIAARANG